MCKYFNFFENLKYEALLIPSISNNRHANSIVAPDWVSLDTFANKVSIKKEYSPHSSLWERSDGSRTAQRPWVVTSPSKSPPWPHATLKRLSGPFKTVRGYGTQAGPWHSTLKTCFQDAQEDSDCGQSSFTNSGQSQRECHTGRHLSGDF